MRIATQVASKRAIFTPAAGPEPIDAVYPNRRTFLMHAQVGSESCRLFYPCMPAKPSGTPVVVRIRIAGEVPVYEVAGTVLRCREDVTGPSSRSGLVIEVRGLHVFEFGRAYAVARGMPPELGRRAERRISVDLPVKLELGRLSGRVADLSRGGAFIEADPTGVATGAVVPLSIRVGLLRRISVLARIAWVERHGAHRGFGVEFLEMSPAHQKRLIKLLHRT